MTATNRPSSAPNIVLTGRFEPGQERRYVHVPFDIPAGLRQLHVRYDYSDRIPSDPLLAGGNTLDIGLFDQRGIASGGPGFRGWSGSSRLAFTIADEWATPPYRPGPIGPGTWHVLLGPYKIGPAGLDYRVEVWFDPDLPVEESPIPPVGLPARPDIAPPAEPGWARGDLHCHTLYSDGDSWPAEVLLAAAQAGLDFLGITDHNSAVRPSADDLPDGMPVLIPGVEVTTYGGHWNAWGVDGWFDFRDPTPAGTQAAMDQAIAAGALVSVNHPKPFGPPWEYAEARGFHAVEVWNGPWERLNAAALAAWEARLRRGERLVAVGGSDTHHLRPDSREPLAPPRIGQPTTWARIEGELTPRSLLAALRAGRCFLSASPAGPQLYVAPTGQGIRVRVVGAHAASLMLVSDAGCIGASAVDDADQVHELSFPPDATYVRAQVVDPYGSLLAIANPVWRD